MQRVVQGEPLPRPEEIQTGVPSSTTVMTREIRSLADAVLGEDTEKYTYARDTLLNEYTNRASSEKRKAVLKIIAVVVSLLALIALTVIGCIFLPPLIPVSLGLVISGVFFVSLIGYKVLHNFFIVKMIQQVREHLRISRFARNVADIIKKDFTSLDRVDRRRVEMSALKTEIFAYLKDCDFAKASAKQRVRIYYRLMKDITRYVSYALPLESKVMMYSDPHLQLKAPKIKDYETILETRFHQHTTRNAALVFDSENVSVKISQKKIIAMMQQFFAVARMTASLQMQKIPKCMKVELRQFYDEHGIKESTTSENFQSIKENNDLTNATIAWARTIVQEAAKMNTPKEQRAFLIGQSLQLENHEDVFHNLMEYLVGNLGQRLHEKLNALNQENHD